MVPDLRRRFTTKVVSIVSSQKPQAIMSREGFVAPSAVNLGNAASGIQAIKNYGVRYVCAQCAVNFTLSPKDPVRCKECGHRVLYKARTKRMVQFEAR